MEEVTCQVFFVSKKSYEENISDIKCYWVYPAQYICSTGINRKWEYPFVV